jgi:ubiquinone/menaquinone biosynthesis C-methylase UbiE
VGMAPINADDAYGPRIVSAFVLAQAVFAAYEVGVWELFEPDLDAEFDPEVQAAERGQDPALLTGLAEYLARRAVLEKVDIGESSPRFRLGPDGRALLTGEWLPAVVYYVGGYGGVLRRAGDLVARTAAYGDGVSRDDHYMALGSELMSRTSRTRTYEAVFERVVALAPRTILDIGCGTGGFLLELLTRTGAERAVGVDVSANACEGAERAVMGAGLADRASIVLADARQLVDLRPDLAGEVDLITAMFVVHEFFSEGFDIATRHLATLARLLRPGMGRLLVLDKHTDTLEREAPFHLTEFKLIHDLTGQVLYTEERWRQLIGNAGYELVAAQRLSPTSTGNILIECRPR